jgi:hypothetical protein
MLGCLLVLAACTTPPVPAPGGSSPTSRVEQPADPMPPLRGEEPTGPSGLTLLIGDTLINVDASTRHRVTDRTGERFEPVAVGADAVLSGFCPDCGLNAGVYALPRAATTATVIGVAEHRDFLGGEVPEERHVRHAGRRGDLLHRRRLVPALDEQPQCRSCSRCRVSAFSRSRQSGATTPPSC